MTIHFTVEEIMSMPGYCRNKYERKIQQLKKENQQLREVDEEIKAKYGNILNVKDTLAIQEQQIQQLKEQLDERTHKNIQLTCKVEAAKTWIKELDEFTSIDGFHIILPEAWEDLKKMLEKNL